MQKLVTRTLFLLSIVALEKASAAELGETIVAALAHESPELIAQEAAKKARVDLQIQPNLLTALAPELNVHALYQTISSTQDPLQAGTMVRSWAQTNASWRSLINGEKETNALAALMQSKWGISRSEALTALSTPQAARTLIQELETWQDRRNELTTTINTLKAKIDTNQPLTPAQMQFYQVGSLLKSWSFWNHELGTVDPLSYALGHPDTLPLVKFSLLAGFKPTRAILKETLDPRVPENAVYLDLFLRTKAIAPAQREQLYRSLTRMNTSLYSPEAQQRHHAMVELFNKY